MKQHTTFIDREPISTEDSLKAHEVYMLIPHSEKHIMAITHDEECVHLDDWDSTDMGSWYNGDKRLPIMDINSISVTNDRINMGLLFPQPYDERTLDEVTEGHWMS